MRMWHVLACAGMLGHHIFEVVPGVGLVWQPQLGLAGAAAGWTALFAGWLLATTSDAPAATAFLAFMAGMSVVGAGVHYTMWPVTWRFGIPWLREAEGLPARLIPAYNLVLFAWGIAGVLALARDVPGWYRMGAIATVATVPLLRASAREHFRWVKRQAEINPAWWNRAFAGG